MREFSRDDRFVQRQLLALQPCRQFCLVRLQLAEPADIRTVGRTDQVGQHVHVAEGFPNDRRRRGRMRQRRPVGARNLATPHRVAPEATHAVLGVSPGELADRQLVPVIQRLVQQLRGIVVACRQRHRGAVQIVIGAARRCQPELLQDLAQFSGRQAGADDRAMQVDVEFPDFRPSRGAAGGPRGERRVVARDKCGLDRGERERGWQWQSIRAASDHNGGPCCTRAGCTHDGALLLRRTRVDASLANALWAPEIAPRAPPP